MSEEAQESQETLEQVAAADEDTQTTDPEPTAPSDVAAAEADSIDNKEKSPKVEDSNELTFDEAQAEIDAIKERAGRAKENLKFAPAASNSTISSSYSSYTPSSMAYEDESPKSRNMLSHLNSNSAMMNYKVTTARNLVQQQEALLRNLKTMRENMERSSVEIGRASTYFSPVRVPQRSYYEKRAEPSPTITRRQVREVSPVYSPYSNLELTEKISERAYSPARISISNHVSTLPPPVSSIDYQPDEDFEKEMASLRKRVADLSKQATEPPMPKFSSYDYGSTLLDNSLGEYTEKSVAPPPEPKIEVKKPRTHKVAPQTHYTKLPPKTVYTSMHVPVDNDLSCSFPVNSYTDYLLETVNNLEPCTNSSSLDLKDLYADPLANSLSDYPSAY